MIIVRTDMHERSGKIKGCDEVCIAREVPGDYAYRLVTALNKECAMDGQFYYKKCLDDYELVVFKS